ncbi:hypothetical protein CERSUDRAFT_159773 [Gelatoporia subvermispora B]|uniref:Uncharacterized protein n=1 Tax=Ceriporiopsis subvermispora (strain B) TaxID=914234 RepID=M2PCY2_CERS8|nr:hypothetical protein CERSUDRAFT_159773 [Gelatoporia subvermispora B]
MDSDSDVLSHFGVLDELIQMIYQGASKFVVISEADDVRWTVHLGLSGSNARWWKGTWDARDIRKIADSHSSRNALQTFATRLADAFVQGELHVGNWSPNTSGSINLTIGTTTKAPTHIDLHELSLQDAVNFSARMFTSIALQAQSRRCRLHSTGSTLPPPPPALPPAEKSGEEELRRLQAEPEAQHQAASSSASTSGVRLKRKAEEAEEKVHVLETQLARARTAGPTSDSSKLVSKTVPAAVPARKGASLANPTRKARKYQALEFDDDDE